MTRLIVALTALMVVLNSPALACDFPIETEKTKWSAQGFSVGELSAPKITRAIQVRWGEVIEADQVFILSKADAPNVALVFSTAGCPHSILVISVDDYKALLKTRGA